MITTMNRRALFALIVLIANVGIACSQKTKPRKAGVRLEYELAKLYTIVGGRRYYIGDAQYRANTTPTTEAEPQALLDPTRRKVFYARTTGCGFENEGMTLFISDIYGRRSIPILSRCEELSLTGFLNFKARYYLIIQQDYPGMTGSSFWLYDIKAKRFLFHGDGEIYEKRKGLLAYVYYGEENVETARTVTIMNLLKRQPPLRLLPRQPIQALTLRRNTKVFLTDEYSALDRNVPTKRIVNRGTKVLIASECPDGSYEIYYKGIRGRVLRKSLRLLAPFRREARSAVRN